jgi:hypothetical protein
LSLSKIDVFVDCFLWKGSESSESLKELNESDDVNEWLRELSIIEHDEHISIDCFNIDKSFTFLWNIAVISPSTSSSC